MKRLITKRLIGVLLSAALLCACAAAEEAGESAVIGGADGPTEIYVAPTSEIVDIEGEVQSESIEGADPVIVDLPEDQVQAVALDEPSAALPLAGVKIGIDPGHQEHANGEQEPNAPGSSVMKDKVLSGTAGVSTRIPEYVTNLEVSFKLRDVLEAMGATVYMTRETNDVDISNMERALMFNDWGVDLGLRIHCNGSSNRSTNGAGTYARSKGDKQAESEYAATVILDALCEATGARRDGVFLRDNYTGQNWATVPCVMVEMGFMSNPEEDVKLNDPEYQQKLAEGMAEGVRRYIETVDTAVDPNALKRGSRGEPVELLQQKLIELGYLDDVADGSYGPKTAAAVSAFQEANGLAATGMADSKTQELIFASAPEPELVAEATPEAVAEEAEATPEATEEAATAEATPEATAEPEAEAEAAAE